MMPSVAVGRVRRRFVTTSFFLVDVRAYSRFIWRVLSVATVNIFSSVNKMMLSSVDEYFGNFFRMAESALQFDSLSSGSR